MKIFILVWLAMMVPFISFAREAPQIELECVSELGDIEVFVHSFEQFRVASIYVEGGLTNRAFVSGELKTDGFGAAQQTRFFYHDVDGPNYGGFHIRVITDKPVFPELVGTGHVTLRDSEKMRNTRINCATFPL